MKVSTFFYLWYAIPEHDGMFNHWNHTVLPHWTEAVNSKYSNIGDSFNADGGDAHSKFFPARGLYSSADEATIISQFEEMKSASIDVAIVSWWGRPDATNGDSQGTSTDEKIDEVLRAAESTGIEIAFHMEPYEGRNVETFRMDVEYINEKYGGSQSLQRYNGEIVFYVYDSYHISYAAWR